ncbi:two-component system nitrate/nitrite response regulator NarL [Variovorax boronicumulans]|uniref:Two-component system nitrate/nitrite response regulator NarL n=1 Tax=Variovorax boronicumulans TaxID=436515 RepID=A0AAW8CPR5_9BURK|nr:response regulator transcription factor [Variovorax boronicumulans]MDP9890942.1 two-component system nitrate/nitrite response regulator NarL [Variovorax boronicumulans]MDQ0051009.1 two-component system nitrate/nitrite response regulator NarL [Variovorax boronicumulans]
MTGAVDLYVRVCHGDPLVMAGLVALIGQEPGFHVQAGNAPDEGIMDVIVADHACALSLLASASALDQRVPAGGFRVPRVIVLTRRDKEGEVMQAIASGAHGYVRQDANPAELMDAIRHVARGGSPYLCKHTMTLLSHGRPGAGFTAREEDVLRFLVKGDCNKGIARKLNISANTVKAHVSRICEKLHVGSRVQVAVKATQRGLVRV